MSPLNVSDDSYRIFKSLDRNNDGLLSLDELKWLLEMTTGVHATQDELVEMFGKAGLNVEEFSQFYESMFKENETRVGSQKGNIDTYKYDEFEVHEEETDEEEESDIYKAFKVFDLNGDGLISAQELQSVLCKLGTWDKKCGLDCVRIIHEYDVNSDGFVDFDEFKRMMLAY